MTDWIGRTLSKVKFRQRLGRGGMAEVDLGQHTPLNRPVTVKILRSHLIEDAQFLERFHTEAVAALRHPNFVQVLDFDVFEQSPYIVMEFISGPSSAESLVTLRQADRRMPPETATRLMVALADALDYAHRHGHMPRDVKPANILLRRDTGPINLAGPRAVDVEIAVGSSRHLRTRLARQPLSGAGRRSGAIEVGRAGRLKTPSHGSKPCA